MKTLAPAFAALLALSTLACGAGTSAVAAVSGNAFDFSAEGGRVAGATITILELPGVSAQTDAEGGFSFPDLEVGSELTFVLDHPDFAPIQTGTFRLPPEGLSRVTFQAPSHDMFAFMATLAGIQPDPERCQLASTVTRYGGSLYGPGGSHGESGATVDSAPPISDRFGPIYFGLYDSGLIYPDRGLTETSEDGGVLFLNVPVGEYTLSAHKEGVVFSQVELECRPGMLVNASPPWGLTVQ